MQSQRGRAGGLVLATAAVLALTVGCSTKPAANTAAASGGGGTHSGGPVVLRDGKSVQVALVSGGPHPYFQPWKPALNKARSDFGLGKVAFDETAEWDQGKQNNVLDSLAAQGYNAFGVFGVSPTDINTTFSDLSGKGVTVASLGSCPAGSVDSAAFCLSTDVEQAAYKATKAAIDAMGGQGTLVHVTGLNADSNTQRRIAGVARAVGETHGKVTLLQTITDIDTDLQTAQKAVSDLLAAKGRQINGIVSTAYNPAVAAATAVKQSGLPIKVVAIDDDPAILAGIRDGSVTATVVQNPAGQAYLGSWVLALLQSKQCTLKKPGIEVDSGSFTVSKSNVDTYDTVRQNTTAALKTQFATQLLSCG
jgi:ribose transport system substrate-binding protein